MDTDELSDTDTDACYHPVGERVYNAELSRTEDGDGMEWSVDCGYCGERLAEGRDPL